MKNARTKLEVPMPAAMPRKGHRKWALKRNVRQNSHASSRSTSTQESAWMNLITIIMKTILQGRGMNSLSRLEMVRKFSYAPSN